MVQGPKGTTSVKFSYNDGQKQVTREMYIQPGIKIDFSGTDTTENGKYRIDSDGNVYNEKGDKIDIIQTTKEQMAALEGMSMAYQEQGSNAKKGTFVLTDADINAAMTENGGYNSSLHVNMRQNALGGNKRTSYRDGQWDTGANPRSGVYQTRLTGDGEASYVEVSSDRTKKQAERLNDEIWAEQHPILNFFKTTFGL